MPATCRLYKQSSGLLSPVLNFPLAHRSTSGRIGQHWRQIKVFWPFFSLFVAPQLYLSKHGDRNLSSVSPKLSRYSFRDILSEINLLHLLMISLKDSLPKLLLPIRQSINRVGMESAEMKLNQSTGQSINQSARVNVIHRDWGKGPPIGATCALAEPQRRENDCERQRASSRSKGRS